jgi:hypothetical protein
VQELKALELKYQGVYQGVCDKRRGVVTGATEVEGAAGGVKGIPKFWLTAMRNSSFLSSFIEEHDVPALEYLTDVSTSFVGAMKVRPRRAHPQAQPNPSPRGALTPPPPPSPSPSPSSRRASRWSSRSRRTRTLRTAC